MIFQFLFFVFFNSYDIPKPFINNLETMNVILSKRTQTSIQATVLSSITSFSSSKILKNFYVLKILEKNYFSNK